MGNTTDRAGLAAAQFAETARVFAAMASNSELCARIAAAAAAIAQALRSGGKVLFCGNGGSAADAQHWAAELVGRFRGDRRPLAAIALTTDSSALTAIGNDYGFEHIFARQVEGLGRPGDVLVAISTSGRSPNVLAALSAAKTSGLATIGVTGASAAAMAARCDHLIAVPAVETARIQELHAGVGHALCALVEAELGLDAAEMSGPQAVR